MNAYAVRTLVIATACALSAGQTLAQEILLPAHRTEHSWVEVQHIRYHTTPLMRRAMQAISEGDDARAETLLREILVKHPDDNHATAHLVHVLDRLGKTSEAIGLVTDLLAHYPDYIDGWMSLGHLCTRAGKSADAMTAFEAVLARSSPADPHRVAAERSLAGLYLDAGNTKMACDYGSRWLAREDGRAVRLFLMECATREGQWDEALAHLDKAESLPPRPGIEERNALDIKRAFLLTRAGRLDDAQAALKASMNVLPGNDQRLAILKQLGLNAMDMGKPDEAATYFAAVLLEAPTPDIQQARLQALLDSGQSDLARFEASQLLKTATDPGVRSAAELALGKKPTASTTSTEATKPADEKHRHAGTAQVQNLIKLVAAQRHGEALKTAQDLAGPYPLDSSDAAVLEVIGACQAHLGQVDDAISTYTAALSVDPKRIGVLYLRGVAYMKRGEVESAGKDFQTFEDAAADPQAMNAARWREIGILAGEIGENNGRAP